MEEDSSFGNLDKDTRETIILAKRKDSEPITTTKANITKACGKTEDNMAMEVCSITEIKCIREDGWMVAPTDLEQ